VKSIAIAAAAALLVLGVAACGGTSSSASSNQTTTSAGSSATVAPSGSGSAMTGPAENMKATTLELAADPSGALKFDKKKLTAPAGKITIRMTNASSVPHDIAIKGGDGSVSQGPVVTDGGVSVVIAILKPGTYTFYCNVDAHEAGGMKGTLVVTG
jgi:plastocyanin